MAHSVHGSCLCGRVTFEVELPFRRANHCHCSRCRKHSGTFGLTQGRVPRSQFRLHSGEESIRVFRPEGGKVKAFCAECPVKEDCLDSALARREPWGVWGGELFVHGKVVAQKRKRGRPPKVRPELQEQEAQSA